MYVIYNKEIDMFARWDEDVILFDSPEQAEEFINEFQRFFITTQPENILITKFYPAKDSNVIKYQDISEEAKQETREIYAQIDEDDAKMRGVLKDE